MKIVVNLDVMMARRKMSLSELAQRVDITMANLSILKRPSARRRAAVWAFLSGATIFPRSFSSPTPRMSSPTSSPPSVQASATFSNAVRLGMRL